MPLQNSSLTATAPLLLLTGARAAGTCHETPDPLLRANASAGVAGAAGVTSPKDCTRLSSATPCDAGPGSTGGPVIGDQLSPDCDSTSALGQLCKGSGCQEWSWRASCCASVIRGCVEHCSPVRAEQSSWRRLRRSCSTRHPFRRQALSVPAQAPVHICTTLLWHAPSCKLLDWLRLCVDR